MDPKEIASRQHAVVPGRGPVVHVRRRDFLMATTALALAGCASTPTQPAREPLDAAAFRAVCRYLETRFGKIAYVELGTGPAALFLHGFPLNSFQWRGALERLSPYRRCVAPDFLGLGYTEVAEGQSVAADAQVDMLVALLDQLSIATVDLVANDSGGAVAQLFVTRHPQRVRTLLLTNCDVEHDSPPAAVVPVIQLAREGRWVDEWLADKELARSDKGIGGMTYSQPHHPTDEAIEYYFAPLVTSARGKAQAHAYAVALEPNPLAGIESALKRCTVPTRTLWERGTPSSHPRAPTICTAPSPTPRAYVECRARSSSSPRSTRTSLPRKHAGFGVSAKGAPRC